MKNNEIMQLPARTLKKIELERILAEAQKAARKSKSIYITERLQVAQRNYDNFMREK